MLMKKILVGVALAFAVATARPASAKDITLHFAVWNYALNVIQSNVTKFEAANPGIKVKVVDYPWPDYQDSMTLRFRAHTPTDVLYVSQDWLPAWAAAGYIAPLNKIAPAGVLDGLTKDIAHFALSDMTYKGKLYGLPYYAGTISFLYNKKIFADAGIPVPQTWSDVMAAAEKLKAGGMEHPFIYEYNQTLPNFLGAFMAQSYGRGAHFFDAQQKAIFDNPDNGAYKQLEWLAEMWKKGLVEPSVHESKIVPAMNTGKYAFTVLFNYNLAALNNPGSSPLAGQFALAPMPGNAHQTLGFAKFYAVSTRTADNPARAEAAWKFIDFMDGKPYAVPKRWAIDKGLGFGQLPLLSDPDVIASWSKWVDMDTLKKQIETARDGTWTEWTAVWSAYFRPLLAKAMIGQESVAEVMKDGANRWNQLRSEFSGQ